MSSTAVLLDTYQAPHELGIDLACHSTHADEARAERRLKDAVRRYYALAELIETERGYVDDLRILVEVSTTSSLHLDPSISFLVAFFLCRFHCKRPCSISTACQTLPWST